MNILKHERRKLGTGLLLNVLFFRLAAGVLFAQNSMDITFEDFPIGARPSFITRDPNSSGYGIVFDGANPMFPFSAFEGTKFLGANGYIHIRSPDARPILSYSLMLFVPSGGPTLHFGVLDGQSPTPQIFDTWFNCQATLTAPRSDIGIFAFSNSTGETFPINFGVDSIHFVTIPEPQTWAFNAIGAIALFLSARYRTNKRRRLA